MGSLCLSISNVCSSANSAKGSTAEWPQRPRPNGRRPSGVCSTGKPSTSRDLRSSKAPTQHGPQAERGGLQVHVLFGVARLDMHIALGSGPVLLRRALVVGGNHQHCGSLLHRALPPAGASRPEPPREPAPRPPAPREWPQKSAPSGADAMPPRPTRYPSGALAQAEPPTSCPIDEFGKPADSARKRPARICHPTFDYQQGKLRWA